MKRRSRVFVSGVVSLLAAAIGPPKLSGGGRTAPPDEAVYVCLQVCVPLNPAVLAWTQSTAGRIYRQIGVRLHWTCDARGAQQGPLVTAALRNSTPADPSRAMGYALPFARGGVRATVLYDRAEPMLADGSIAAGIILGHVLAHELGHVLIGVDAHSGRGLMRGHWNSKDFASMRTRPLDFSSGEANVIRRNIRRNGRMAFHSAAGYKPPF